MCVCVLGGGGGVYIDVMSVDLASTLCCYLGSFFTKPVSIYNEQKVVISGIRGGDNRQSTHNTRPQHNIHACREGRREGRPQSLPLTHSILAAAKPSVCVCVRVRACACVCACVRACVCGYM